MTNKSRRSESLGNKELFIWDQVGAAPDRNCTVIYWRDYPECYNKIGISIVDIVENNYEELKAKYLSWVYDFGESEVDGKSIKEHLIISTGFSYWWASSIAQKFNISDESQINNAIKVLALEDLIKKNNFRIISISSSNKSLIKVIKNFCNKKSLSFELKKEWIYDMKNIDLNFIHHIPDTLIVFLYLLRYLKRTFHMNFINNIKNSHDGVEVTLIDVLVHLDKTAISLGKFKSNYWTTLVDVLNQTLTKTNWLHIYFQHSVIPTLKEANKLIKDFNSNKFESHQILERRIKIKNFINVISDYRAICRSFRLLKNLDQIHPKNSNMNIWYLHKKEWKTSLCGVPAIDTCLKLNQFLDICADLPKQRLGIYIAENQPWELALIHAWKITGHKYLIGVPHTTIRNWDLRYFNDYRCYLEKNSNRFPMPDALAVNGPAAYNTLTYGGYPKGNLIQVEALRFLHLNRTSKHKERPRNKRPLRVLICGDFLEKTSLKILSLIAIASQSMPSETEYVFKPHPAYPLNLDKFCLIKIQVRNDKLEDLFIESDVVITSNITSAAVDAFFSGVKVIQVLDGNSFKSSPLLDMHIITYVKNPRELVEEIGKFENFSEIESDPKTYFHLNEDLIRWRELLRLKLINKKE
jgi:surface carbohydrate biosynthesis protein (TIGR04326 family)